MYLYTRQRNKHTPTHLQYTLITHSYSLHPSTPNPHQLPDEPFLTFSHRESPQRAPFLWPSPKNTSLICLEMFSIALNRPKTRLKSRRGASRDPSMCPGRVHPSWVCCWVSRPRSAWPSPWGSGTCRGNTVANTQPCHWTTVTMMTEASSTCRSAETWCRCAKYGRTVSCCCRPSTTSSHRPGTEHVHKHCNLFHLYLTL